MIPNVSQAMHQFYGSGTALEHDVVNTMRSAMGPDVSVVAEANHGNHSNTLLYCLTLLKEKVHQIQSLVRILVSPNHHHHHQSGHPSTSAAVISMGNLIQEVIMTASSMMFTCQQMISAATPPRASPKPVQTPPQGMFGHNEGSAGLDWYADSNNFVIISCGSNQNSITHYATCNNNNSNSSSSSIGLLKNNDIGSGNTTDYDVIEPDASELLAKYTHYCQICGEGFKRDGNLRMHMRAHGDEYKSNSLRNPIKKGNNGNNNQVFIKPPGRKYSCPQEGCRWNQKHPKFQPLKSMICIKNHYKRSHCPKIHVCKRCNRKQFSVLSDLQTHEKHCGNLEWRCSCGTTFSRKDKLMGHVKLFNGHTPAVNISKPAMRVDRNQLAPVTSMQIDDRG